MIRAHALTYDDVLCEFDELTISVYQNRRKVEQVVERLEHPSRGQDSSKKQQLKKEVRDAHG